MRMKGPYVQKATAADGQLLAGGVELLQIDANAGQKELAFSVHAAPDARPRVRLARLR